MKACMEMIGFFIIVFTVICTIVACVLAWQYWQAIVPTNEITGVMDGGNKVRFLAIIAGIILSALVSAGFGCFLMVLGRMARGIERIAVNMKP